ncbi:MULTISPECIES: SDR family NAD(P)-dependent oxidoreductase [Maribacter]|uniref:SDR family NAD(P)-dependent oxidoreductase n=1 Tax=Maribacter flavus TaxID=1658664 RepID=A0ABU7IGI3_9FLAO|nr:MULTISPECIES: SDR family NAD(P)-dependent oxidoreductase [Maribacter]MDC6404645.1 SDR family NAD(P)-dependent oxidoreductase [Maribacter sp. PR66]MEE1972057.1 SDR family NAD(P)-dependent oxidoreductase [Maribacter flavus]
MKHGIVTGSSRGIGLATVEVLTKQPSFKVIGSSTSGNNPLDNANFQCFKLDLSSSDSITKFAVNLGDIKLNFLINNAGILLEKWDASKINMEQLKKTFDINVFGTIKLTEKLLPLFKSKAHIINITSDWGSFSEQNFDAFQPHYKMSKAALNMYTKLLAKRLERNNITVSSLDPGWTQTDMGGKIAPRLPKEVAEDILNLLNNEVETGKFWHQGKIRPW